MSGQMEQEQMSFSSAKSLKAAVVVVLLLAGPARAEDLQTLIRQLLENNPAIAAARRAVDARKAKVTAARTLPEPSDLRSVPRGSLSTSRT